MYVCTVTYVMPKINSSQFKKDKRDKLDLLEVYQEKARDEFKLTSMPILYLIVSL